MKGFPSYTYNLSAKTIGQLPVNCASFQKFKISMTDYCYNIDSTVCG
jgi:hypothetical protein